MIWQKIIKNRWVQHLSFWALSYLILLRLFAYQDELFISDYIYTFLFHLSLLLVVYLNLRLLIPLLLQKSRYWLYFLALFVVFVLGVLFNEFTFNYLSDRLFPNYYFISYYTYVEISQFIGSYLVVSMLFKFSKAWFEVQQKEQQIHQLEADKAAAELKALKAQLEPHFLFNNLNSLYAMSMESDERTPEMILSISESMRYILYECQEKEVLLEKEVRFLKNYLELQQIRLQNKDLIRLDIKGNIANQRIAPLLFLPFLENAIKHGIHKSDSPLQVSLEVEPSHLQFRIQNRIRPKDRFLQTKSGGIGLRNVQRRLDLLYPQRHELDISEQDQLFCVKLNLSLT
ncbi:MAG: histidine kinase [Saprospiraceae bacterium]|nr:histidine kinase [Saprospiraceae bacterium]